MRAVLLGVAAVAATAVAAPAAAQNFTSGGTGVTAQSNGSHHRFRVGGVGERRVGRFDCSGFNRDGFRHDGRRDRRDRSVVECSSGLWVNGGEWALYNNRTFEPDSYNDWWHDRPDRAYPRWVQDQRGASSCDPERMWWSGSGWRC